MSDRLDRVTVVVPSGNVTLSWDTREALLIQLEREQETNTDDIRTSFEAAGASRPVELSAEQRAKLTGLLGEWLMDDEIFFHDAPEGLTELYVALNRGEPWEAIVEDWELGDAELGRGFGSMNWRWRWENWQERPRPHDHLHCGFCNTRFSGGQVHSDLDQGWCSLDETDYERWVCAGCFDKLHERFGWKVETDSSRQA